MSSTLGSMGVVALVSKYDARPSRKVPLMLNRPPLPPASSPPLLLLLLPELLLSSPSPTSLLSWMVADAAEDDDARDLRATPPPTTTKPADLREARIIIRFIVACDGSVGRSMMRISMGRAAGRAEGLFLLLCSPLRERDTPQRRNLAACTLP